MSNKPDELDEILEKLLLQQKIVNRGLRPENPIFPTSFNYDEAKAQIISWAKSKVPEKKKYPFDNLLEWNREYAEALGYNQAIDETLKNLERK